MGVWTWRKKVSSSFYLESMWSPCGLHLGSYGLQQELMWSLSGVDVKLMWRLCGAQVKSMWSPSGAQVEYLESKWSVCGVCGVQVESMWKCGGV